MAALTDPEWDSISLDFPNLVRADTLKTGPVTKDYNCIRFALATPGLWVNPPPQLHDFVEIFEDAGWVICPYSEGIVDGYVLEDGIMSHASRYTTDWESKIGDNIRIQHVRTQLTSHPLPGSIYGNIVVSFKKKPPVMTTASPVVAVQASAPSPSETSTGSGAPAPESTPTENVAEESVKIDAVVSVLGDAFPALADDFETRYAAWKATWFNKHMINKESSADRATGIEWDKLVALTAKVLPQVVAKLKSVEDLFAVEIYNKLQTDTKKKVSSKDSRNYYYLDAQAKNIIQLYGSGVAVFDTYATEWKNHCVKIRNSSNSKDYINHPSFDAIVAMGKEHAVPLVMAEYSQNVGGWWHELMYELVHGRKSGANTFDKKALYEEWKEFFETRTGEAAAAA